MSQPPRISRLERCAWALVCLLVFTLPWEKSVQAPGIGTISRMAGFAAFGAGAAAAWRRRAFRPPNLALILAALFAMWSGLTWFWSLDPPATAARFLTLAQLVGMTWLIWEFCRGPARQQHLMAAYVLGGMVASGDTILRYVQNIQTYYRRYAATGFEPNDAGLTLALSLPLALYLAPRSRGVLSLGCRLAAILAIPAILLTASRSALVVTFLAFLFPALTWTRASWRERAWSAGLLAFLLSGLFQFAPEASRERLAGIQSELASGTLHGRTAIWKAGLRVVKSHPLIGAGAGAYPEAVRPRLGVPGRPGHRYVAHNTFLSVLAECGLAGFVLFAGMLATLALYIFLMPPPERALWFVMLAAWATGVMTLTWEHRKPGWLLFALIMTGWARLFRAEDRRA